MTEQPVRTDAEPTTTSAGPSAPETGDTGNAPAPDDAPEVLASPVLDVERVKRDFPILSRQVHEQRLVYLDNAATSQKPECVIEAISDYYRNHNANVHRGVHALAEEATEAYEHVRGKVARFLDADDPGSVVFTRNTTESINLVAHSWGRKFLGEGDEIVLTVMEHHSNLVPWQLLAEDVGCTLRFVDMTDDGHLRLDELEEKVGERTRLVAVAHVSNSLGTIHPVRRIADIAHDAGALLLVDGAQGVPHARVSLKELDADFYAFSPHKACGPTGVGVLWARRDLLEEMDPFLGGGEMIRDVSLERSTWASVPHKFEAGTPNIADVVGLGAAIDYLAELGMDRVRAHEQRVIGYGLDRLEELEFLTVHGPRDPADRCGLVSFTDADIHPHDLGTVVDRCGVAIRAGHHCTKPLMRRLGVMATARASFYIYNDEDDVDALVDALHHAREVFGV